MPVAPIPRVDFSDDHGDGLVAGGQFVDGGGLARDAFWNGALGQIAGRHRNDLGEHVGEDATFPCSFDLNRKSGCRGARRASGDQCGRRTDLPINLPNPPTYRKVNPADSPVLVLALTVRDAAAVASF